MDDFLAQNMLDNFPFLSASSKSRQRELSQFEMEQQTLASIARMLNSTLDLNVVLKKVVEAATSLTQAEQGLLLMPDEDGKALYIRAAKGFDDETAREFRIKTDDTVAGRVYKTGEPALVCDGNLQKVKTAYLVRSLLYVAMSVKGQVIGVLGVNNRDAERDFSEHDRYLLEGLASHAAIAIENARLYGESINRSRELATLVRASQAVNSSLSLADILPIISEQLIDMLKVGCSEILTWEPSSQFLNLLFSYRHIEWHDSPPIILSEHQHQLFQQTIERHEPLTYTPDSSPLKIAERQSIIDTIADFVYVVPLYANKRPLGILEFVFTGKDYPDSSYFSQNAFQQQGLELVLALGPLGVEKSARAQYIATHLLEITQAQLITLWFWNSNQHEFQARLSAGQGIWLGALQPKLKLQRYTLLAQVLREKRPLVIPDDTALATEAAVLLSHYEAQTLLLLPILINEQVLGIVIVADTLARRHFREREIELAAALVLQAANAMQNAWLYSDLQKSLEELRHTQSKLVQSARLSAIGELAAAVAHQINNPLTTVLGETQILIEDLEENDPTLESVKAIYRAGKRAYEVVRRLLGMAYKNDESAEREPMDVNTTLQNTLALVTGHIQRGKVEMVFDLCDNLPLVYGLRGQLEDVWLNLLLNARDAVINRENPMIGIRSWLGDDHQWTYVEVWDNGPGIPPEKLNAIFEAFYTTKARGEGTGLGLHICKQVIQQCGGSIKVQNLPDGGASFVVALPIALEAV